jgi:hypothetical protein
MYIAAYTYHAQHGICYVLILSMCNLFCCHCLPEDDKHSPKRVGEIIFAITCKIILTICAVVSVHYEI